MDAIRAAEKSVIDMLDLLNEELKSLRGENNDVNSDIDALYDELQSAMEQATLLKNSRLDEEYNLFQAYGLHEKKRLRLLELQGMLDDRDKYLNRPKPKVEKPKPKPKPVEEKAPTPVKVPVKAVKGDAVDEMF